MIDKTWTPERDAELKRLWQTTSLSGTQIAARLFPHNTFADGGRNVVLGRADRLRKRARDALELAKSTEERERLSAELNMWKRGTAGGAKSHKRAARSKSSTTEKRERQSTKKAEKAAERAPTAKGMPATEQIDYDSIAAEKCAQIRKPADDVDVEKYMRATYIDEKPAPEEPGRFNLWSERRYSDETSEFSLGCTEVIDREERCGEDVVDGTTRCTKHGGDTAKADKKIAQRRRGFHHLHKEAAE